MAVRIDQPERMSLLGLILASLLERNLADAHKARAAAAMHGKAVVRSGEMAVTIAFGAGGVVITRGAAPDANASLSGPLDALTDLSLGRSLVRQGLRLTLRGNLLLLLRLWRLLRVPAPPDP